MKRITDEQRTNNECPKGRYEGNLHRWRMLDMPLWYGPHPFSVGQGDEDSNESFLPRAYAAVRFVCAKCGTITWEDVITTIDAGEGSTITEESPEEPKLRQA